MKIGDFASNQIYKIDKALKSKPCSESDFQFDEVSTDFFSEIGKKSEFVCPESYDDVFVQNSEKYHKSFTVFEAQVR